MIGGTSGVGGAGSGGGLYSQRTKGADNVSVTTVLSREEFKKTYGIKIEGSSLEDMIDLGIQLVASDNQTFLIAGRFTKTHDVKYQHYNGSGPDSLDSKATSSTKAGKYKIRMDTQLNPRNVTGQNDGGTREIIIERVHDGFVLTSVNKNGSRDVLTFIDPTIR